MKVLLICFVLTMKEFPCPLVAPDGVNELVEVRKRLKQADLFRFHPRTFLMHLSVNCCLLLSSIVVLYATNNVWIQVINAIVLAFTFTQFNYVVHDLAHYQVFKHYWKSDVLGRFAAFVLGASYLAWMETHNEHHLHTNHEDHDPDLQVDFFAFSKGQMDKRPAWGRWIMQFQHLLLFPSMISLSVVIRVNQLRHVIQRKNIKKYWPEFVTIIGHPLAYFGIIFTALPFWTGLLFFAVHQVAWGMYSASSFAPNHKGMPMVKEGQASDYFRRQVLTCRNIKPSILIDYVYGGLNYQIEHHLFPTMPRQNFRKARKIIQEYCIEREVPYHETGVIGSYWEILKHMWELSKLARNS